MVVTASSNTGQVFLIDPTTGTRALIRTLTPSITGVTIRENRVLVARSNNTVTSLVSGQGGNPFQASSWSQEFAIGSSAGFTDGLTARFNAPYLLSSGTGRVLLADTSNHRIRELILPNFIGGFSTQAVTFSNATRTNSNGTSDYVVGRLEAGAERTIDATFTVQFAAAMTFYVTVYGDIDGVIPVDGGPARAGSVRNLAGRIGLPTFRDGVGAEASVAPTSMSATDTDYVFFSESSRIRVLSPTGKVTTIAGFGSGAQVNGSGETFSAGDTIRSISASRDGRLLAFATRSAVFMGRLTGTSLEKPADWQFARIAGDAAVSGNALGDGNTARFNLAFVSVDTAERVYLVDANSNTARFVIYRGGLWTNAANWTVNRLAGPLDGSSGFTDGTENSVRFNNPIGLAPNVAGNFVIVDAGNLRLRILDGVVVSSLQLLPPDDYYTVAVDDSNRIYLRSNAGIQTLVNGQLLMIVGDSGTSSEGSNLDVGTEPGLAMTVNRATGRLFFFRS